MNLGQIIGSQTAILFKNVMDYQSPILRWDTKLV